MCGDSAEGGEHCASTKMGTTSKVGVISIWGLTTM